MAKKSRIEYQNELHAIFEQARLDKTTHAEVVVPVVFARRVFGISESELASVENLPELTPMPGAAPTLAGTTHVRGRNVLVFDPEQATDAQIQRMLSSCSLTISDGLPLTDEKASKKRYLLMSKDATFGLILKVGEAALPPPLIKLSTIYSHFGETIFA